MARQPGPVRPRRLDERAHERLLRREVVDPLFARMRAGLVQAGGAARALQLLDLSAYNPDHHDLPIEEIRAHMLALEGYHRARLIRTFMSALGVDIRPYLLRPEIASYMAEVVSANVDLIVTIGPEAHEGLKRRLLRELAEAPFDEDRLLGLLREEYRSTGYRARRIARDQTTKTIGKLTEKRHRQIGVAQYRWSTSQDDRVRPTHVAHEGQVFRWDEPPLETGHPGYDIQCRCVAIPIVPLSMRGTPRKVA